MIPIPVIDAALQVAAAALKVIDKALPSDELRLAKFKARYPLQFERIEKKKMAVRLRKLRQLHRYMQQHGLSAETLSAYIGGDSTTVEILKQFETKNK